MRLWPMLSKEEGLNVRQTMEYTLSHSVQSLSEGNEIGVSHLKTHHQMAQHNLMPGIAGRTGMCIRPAVIAVSCLGIALTTGAGCSSGHALDVAC